MRRFSGRGWGRIGVSAAISALAVGALASIGAAVSPSGTAAATSQYTKKVAICHRTHSKKHPFVTIVVSRNAVPAHLRHGDTIGPCPTAAATKKAKNAKKAKKVKAAHAPKVKSHGRSAKAAPAAQATTARGRSGTAPGHTSKPDRSSTPRTAASPPGHDGTAPGNSENAPGQAASPPGHDGTAPGNSENAPGHTGSSPGHGGTPPGQGGTPPGQDKKQ
jgi:hypothetical protein